MKHSPGWLKSGATILALFIFAVLLAGIFSVPFRSTRPPEGYNQSRLHWNTKNSTRLQGRDLAELSSSVSRAVYPAAGPESRPEIVLLYPPDDWRAGLVAASLLRPLNGVLLPDTEGIMTEVERLQPSGSQALGGSSVLRLTGDAQETDPSVQSLSLVEVPTLRGEVGEAPRHAIVVDPEDPTTALLAAPWAAYSGDLVVFDVADVPAGLPYYLLGAGLEGSSPEEPAGQIIGRAPEETAVRFAEFSDPANPSFGWGFNSGSQPGYRSFILANRDDPASALLSANLARRGKPGPLLWTGEHRLPQVVDNYLWTQRAAFWVTPSEGPFHHVFILGDTSSISFPAQSQADYALEIGPYFGKGPGMSGMDMLAAVWVVFGLASSGWIAFHQTKFLPHQMWVMRLAWPLMALMTGPFGVPIYHLAYNRPVVHHGERVMWDRPLWLQGLVATVSAVGFGASLMIVSGFITTFFGAPLFPNQSAIFILGTPMILIMIINYVFAVLISWPLFQTPMLSLFYNLPYRETLGKALPMVLGSMAAAALAMNPGMWWLMMSKLPMMPTEESILWFGVMFFTAFLALLSAWPLNYYLVRIQRKSGLM